MKVHPKTVGYKGPPCPKAQDFNQRPSKNRNKLRMGDNCPALTVFYGILICHLALLPMSSAENRPRHIGSTQ